MSSSTNGGVSAPCAWCESQSVDSPNGRDCKRETIFQQGLWGGVQITSTSHELYDSPIKWSCVSRPKDCLLGFGCYRLQSTAGLYFSNVLGERVRPFNPGHSSDSPPSLYCSISLLLWLHAPCLSPLENSPAASTRIRIYHTQGASAPLSNEMHTCRHVVDVGRESPWTLPCPAFLLGFHDMHTTGTRDA